MSVQIYTHKKHLKNLKLIEPEEFYDTNVLNAVDEKLYELDSNTKALIAEEKDILKLDGNRIETKYGKFSLRDLSYMTKLKITMHFIRDLCFDDYVICLDRTGKKLAEALRLADELNIKVFIRFEFFADSWRDIRTEVKINNEPQTYELRDIFFKYAFESSGINDFGLSSETNISFKGENATYDIWLSTVKTNIMTDSIFQKRAFMRDMKNALDSRTLKIVSTHQAELTDIELEAQQLLYVTKNNLSDIRDKLSANKQPYIIVYDADYEVIEEMLCSVGNKAVNTIAVRTVDESCYFNNTYLEEKELLADGENPTRFEYTLRDDSFGVERRSDIKFETLDFNL